jgi:hypothetical protein
VSSIAVSIANEISSGRPTAMIQSVLRIACQNWGSFVNMNE